MTAVLLPVLIVGYVVLASMFLGAVWRAPRLAKWLGLAAIAMAAPFFFWLGVFAEQFGAGQCYTSAVGMIADAVERTNAPQQLAMQLRDLPMHGYETVCQEVVAAARKLPGSGERGPSPSHFE